METEQTPLMSTKIVTPLLHMSSKTSNPPPKPTPYKPNIFPRWGGGQTQNKGGAQGGDGGQTQNKGGTQGGDGGKTLLHPN